MTDREDSAAAAFSPAKIAAGAFMAGFCLMLIEIAAARILAWHHSNSIRTWTTAIGVILAGVACGNAAGGLFSGKSGPQEGMRRALLTASVSVAAGFVLHLRIADGLWVYKLPHDFRMAAHAALLSFVPAFCLGATTPLFTGLSKSEGDLRRGRAAGRVFGWTSAGALPGTFFTGFWLIPLIGTAGVLWMAAGILALAASAVHPKKIKARLWLTGVAAAAWLALWPGDVARSAGTRSGLRLERDPKVLLERESGYFHLAVTSDPGFPNLRELVLDNLLHSSVDVVDPLNLRYEYHQVCAALIDAAADPGPLKTLTIGGGGYALPRYLAASRAGSVTDVIEIDPAVTSAARAVLGLEESSIRVYHGDGRVFMNRLAARAGRDDPAERYDFIFSDAFEGLNIPFHLVTLEFFRRVKTLLAPDGVYAGTVIDRPENGALIGAIVSTAERVFRRVEVLVPRTFAKSSDRQTFVVTASDRTAGFPVETGFAEFRARRLSSEEIEGFKKRAGGRVLTDNHAPVERLLGLDPHRGPDIRRFDAFLREAVNADQKGETDKAIGYLEKGLELIPYSSKAHNHLGVLFASKGDGKRAAAHFREAVRLNPADARAHYNLGLLLAQEGDYASSIGEFEEALRHDGRHVYARYNLGISRLRTGKREEARSDFTEALLLRPDFAEARQMLESLERSEEADADGGGESLPAGRQAPRRVSRSKP